MNDAFAVYGFQRARDLQRNINDPLHFQRRSTGPALEGLPLE